VLSRCSAVLADQTSDGVPALDPGSYIDGLAGFVQGRSLVPCLMGPVGVVVSGVLGQDAPEVLLAVDQHVIEALAAKRARVPFRERICPRRADGSLDDLRAVAGEDLIECRSELATSIADEEPEAACPVAGIHEQAAGLPSGPGFGGVGR
jgi:hypothetical protein